MAETWMLEGLRDYMDECDRAEEYANTLKAFEVKGYAWIERLYGEDIAEETRHDFEIEIEACTAEEVEKIIMDLWKDDRATLIDMIDYPKEFSDRMIEDDYIDYCLEEIDVL